MFYGFLLFCISPAAAYKRGAKRHLQVHLPGRFEQVWRTARDQQRRLVPNRPRHGVSINHMIRYFEWNTTLYRALQEHGMSQPEAIALVEMIMSDVYQPVPATFFNLSRLRSADHATRVKWILGMTTGHFLAAPFCYRHLASKTGVDFDVLSCPFADYFKEQGVPELTEPAAGNLDYCMAREWGVELVRTQTIADGAEHCDFRWKLPAARAE